jgi:hypothetical protein
VSEDKCVVCVKTRVAKWAADNREWVRAYATERRTKNRATVRAYAAKYARERRAADPEYRAALNERARQRRATNPERRAAENERARKRNGARYANDPAYRAKNLTAGAKRYAEKRAEVLAQCAKYRAENREQVLARKAKYRAENPEKVAAQIARSRAAKPKKYLAMSSKYRALKKAQKCECCSWKQIEEFYIQTPPGAEVDHITPLEVGAILRLQNLHCLSNFQRLAKGVHKEKTATNDLPLIARLKREKRAEALRAAA